MKVLVLGATGMLGHKLIQGFTERFDLWAASREADSEIIRLTGIHAERLITGLDAEDFEAAAPLIKKIGPDVVVNAIGVVKQLPTSKNVVKTLTINSIFPHKLAELVGEAGGRLITISTDCVFSGKKGMYREEDISDAEDVYGKSKWLGEVSTKNCLTIRTSIIGREIKTAHSLLDWFLGNEAGKVKGYRNAIYSGFPTQILADIIADLIINNQELNGLYHISSEPIGKYDLLCLIREAYGANIEIEPFDDFCLDRSLDSSRFRQAAGFRPMGWPEMIRLMAEDPTPYKDWRKRL